jgi:fructose-bisphosphate aldolase, class II
VRFVPMLDLLRDATTRGYAVPSFCVWHPESMLTVLRAAERLRAPVILMHGPCELVTATPALMAAMAREVAEDFDVPAALHVDHGDSPELVSAALAAGYTSVMLDYSAKAYEENAAAMRAVTEMARPLGVTVEGELGHVGKVGDATAEGVGESTLTDPAEAAAFVRETGVDALAVSIGNAHGQYTQLPSLDLNRLARIHEAVGVPLVLHGGSGTPPDDLRRAISLGVAKVNVATESMTAVRESLIEQWREGRNPWMPAAMAEAMDAMDEVVEKWIRLTGAKGQAAG